MTVLYPCGIAAAQDKFPISDKDIDELASMVKEIFNARSEYDRSAALELTLELKEKIAEIEDDYNLDDLLRFTDLWRRIREGAIDGSETIFTRTGWGFQDGEFIDNTESPEKKYVYFISLPDEYDDEIQKRFPVIIFLHPEIKGRYTKLEREVFDILKALYDDDDILENYIIIAPVGPMEEIRRREELIDAGKDWEDLEVGRKTAFIAIRLLLENMVFDRSRIFIHGIGKAGLSAFRYATWYPSFFAGVIGRDADLSLLALENTRDIPFVYVSTSDNSENNKSHVLNWIDSHSKNDGPINSHITFLEDSGERFEPSIEAKMSLKDWISNIDKDTAPKEVFLKAIDLAKAGAYWLRITELNVGIDTKLTDPDAAWIKGKIDSESNSIHLESERVLKMLIFLNDKLVNLDKKVSVFVNGTKKYEGMIERDLEKMLDLMYYNTAGDFEIYCNFREFTLVEG
jgi:hypothetical protein